MWLHIICAHYLYMHDERLADKELQNIEYFILLQCVRACFCYNVFAMYFMKCICNTPKQSRIQNYELK